MANSLLDQHIRIRLSHDILASTNVVQGDTARELYFIVDDYEIPNDAEYRIYIRKPSGREIYNYCYYANGEIVVQLTTQMISEIGTNSGQIQIVNNNVILTSFNFNLNVSENMILSSDITSKDEFGILDELINNARLTINEMDELIQKVEEQESKRDQSETERKKAELDRQGAESQRVLEFDGIKQEFLSLKNESTTATNNAIEATSQTKTATENANNAADRANQISDKLETAVSGVINDNQISNLTTYSSNKISSDLGKLTDLSTTNKTNIVGAINDVQDQIDILDNELGDLADLSTTKKNNLVDSINDVQEQIGTLSQLPTVNKTSIVDSISEILSLVQISTDEPEGQPIGGWWMKEV